MKLQDLKAPLADDATDLQRALEALNSATKNVTEACNLIMAVGRELAQLREALDEHGPDQLVTNTAVGVALKVPANVLIDYKDAELGRAQQAFSTAVESMWEILAALSASAKMPDRAEEAGTKAIVKAFGPNAFEPPPAEVKFGLPTPKESVNVEG